MADKKYDVAALLAMEIDDRAVVKVMESGALSIDEGAYVSANEASDLTALAIMEGDDEAGASPVNLRRIISKVTGADTFFSIERDDKIGWRPVRCALWTSIVGHIKESQEKERVAAEKKAARALNVSRALGEDKTAAREELKRLTPEQAQDLAAMLAEIAG